MQQFWLKKNLLFSTNTFKKNFIEKYTIMHEKFSKENL